MYEDFHVRHNVSILYSMQNNLRLLLNSKEGETTTNKTRNRTINTPSHQIRLLLLLINHRSKLLKCLLIHRVSMFRRGILPTLNLIPVL